MNEYIINRWEQNKHLLEHYFAGTTQGEYDSYESIVKAIIRKVLNPQDDTDITSVKFSSNITVVDDGDYQGVQLFIFHVDTYQPSEFDYVITNNYYGSCSGCDTLLSISNYYDVLPTDEQIKEYMTLSLHLVQKMKYIYHIKE